MLSRILLCSTVLICCGVVCDPISNDRDTDKYYNNNNQFFAGIIGHSSAMIADAGHSLSDLLSDAVTLWAVRLSRLPPDDDHPYGHGR